METVTQAEILSIKEFSENLREYVIKPEIYRRFEAGSFLQFSLGLVNASDYWPESRPFSIASAYNKEKTMRLIIRKVGSFTTKIFNELNVGDKITIKYFFGDMNLPEDDENEVICIAAGSGIAPFIGFYEELKQENKLNKFRLLYTVRKEEDFISYTEFCSNLSEKQYKFFVTDKKSDKGLNRLMNINDILELSHNNKDAHYYICGSPEFIIYFKSELEKKGIKNIYLDEWE
ncbi:MAG: ferredoxin--NADP reductase [Francisella sp.]